LTFLIVPAEAGFLTAGASHPASGLIVVPAKSGIHLALAVVIACEEQERFVRYAAEFISFDKRHCTRRSACERRSRPRRGERHGWRESKKRTKEKRFSRHGNPMAD
jgi:hypothetical protein